MVTIYQAGTQTTRAVVDPDTSSQQEQEVMGKDIVTLSFTMPVAENFQIGDYAIIFGAKYTLNTAPSLQKTATRDYAYKLTLEGKVQDMGRVGFMFLDANNQFTDSDFSMMGKLADFGNLLVLNMQRVFPNDGWVLGGMIDTDYQSLPFSNVSCLAAMNDIVKAFDSEWYVDGTKIYLYKRQPTSGVTLGYNSGVYSITRSNQDNSNVITRLYAYGSDKNLGSNYRNGAKRLRMANGLFIDKNITKYGLFEAATVFDTIYPQRTGNISAVSTPFVFTDAAIDFNVNQYLLPGTTAQITFNTGLLAGYTFDIASYNDATKTFTINQNTSDPTTVLPTTTLLPAVGDTYVLINILMPTKYVDAAEAALLAQAQQYLNDNCEPKYKYEVVCDPVYFKRNNIGIKLGQTVGLIDQNLAININIRVFGLTRNIRLPYLYTLTLSDFIAIPLLTKIINLIKP